MHPNYLKPQTLTGIEQNQGNRAKDLKAVRSLIVQILGFALRWKARIAEKIKKLLWLHAHMVLNILRP